MKKIIYLLITGGILLGSCSKEIKLAPGLEDFNVIIEKTTVKAGEEVRFHLEGNPDIITFYSGELGNDYEYRNGREIGMDETILSFSSARSSGTRQPDQLRVLASSSFSGDYNFASLHPEDWVDITDRFALAPDINFLSSGLVDISDVVVPGKPLYIAYRYIARSQAEYGGWQIWNIQAFSLTGQTVLGPLPLGNTGNSGFRLVEEKPEAAPSRSSLRLSSANLVDRIILNAPETSTDVSLLPVEVWAVSRGFETEEIDNGPDSGTGIKGKESQPLTSYVHIYDQKGVYTAYFLATNANVSGSKQVIRKVEITVID